jgi:hypothetical protein
MLVSDVMQATVLTITPKTSLPEAILLVARAASSASSPRRTFSSSP